jgi:two-component system, chemotaxis family, sensor kinase Cph1
LRSTVADLRQTQERLQSRSKELARSNEDLQRFAYAASHDLQEPLRMIGGFTELLASKHRNKDAETDECVQSIWDGVVRMKKLIDDLLEYSRLAQDERQTERLVPIKTAFGEALLNLQTTMTETGATITFDPLPSVMVNQSIITQVFQNLIGNAIKYRSEQPSMIHVGVQRDGESWTFSVADNGIGIDMAHAEQIFNVFTRLHSRKEYGGTGIGLPLLSGSSNGTAAQCGWKAQLAKDRCSISPSLLKLTVRFECCPSNYANAAPFFDHSSVAGFTPVISFHFRACGDDNHSDGD